MQNSWLHKNGIEMYKNERCSLKLANMQICDVLVAVFFVVAYRVFSRDLTAAMFVSLNKGTAAMLVSTINPPGIQLFSCANVFFCFG